MIISAAILPYSAKTSQQEEAMSAAAVATLRQRWEKLTLARVNRVIAREPEDVLSIDVRKAGNHVDYYVRSNRTKDIPEKDRHRAHVAWRHYFGFTDGGIYFQKPDFHGLDCDIDLTMNWSTWGNHMGGWDKPEVGSMIAGEVVNTPKGKRFSRWFYCRPEFKLLVDIVRNGTTIDEDELGRRLLTPGFPDQYWAIARLVLFDNVQAFVDDAKSVDWDNDSRPLHPAHGMETGSVMWDGERLTVGHRGMYHTKASSEFVHMLSYQLKEPRWWEGFKRLAGEQGVSYGHRAERCWACEAEYRSDPDRFYAVGPRLTDFDPED